MREKRDIQKFTKKREKSSNARTPGAKHHHHHRSWIQRLLVWVPPVGFRNYQTGRPLAYATLNVHRHKIGVTDIPFCPPATTNTVFHFIRMHSTYRLQRERLQASFKGKDSPIRFLLTNVEALKPLFEFIHNTKRIQ